MEVDELDLAVKIFNQSRATFNPISAVQILHSVDHLHLGAMNVAANDAVSLMVARHRGKRVFVFGDIFHGGLGLGFQISRERPITETQPAAQSVEIQVEIENPIVEMRSELFQQVIEMRQTVRLVAMDDEIFFAIRRSMNHLMRHDHVAKTHPGKLINELVMVTGDVDDLRLFATFAEEFLNQQIIIVAPKPAKLQFPTVNQIADDVEIFAVHRAQKFQQLRNARVLRAEMDVRNPD
jgi:hypothetical protein